MIEIIYKTIRECDNHFGITSYSFYNVLTHKGIDTNSEEFINIIESLIVDKNIRAYFPNNSYEYYFQLI